MKWQKRVSNNCNLIIVYIEKAVYLCMTDDVGDYDELEDDFLLLANEGKPAII